MQFRSSSVLSITDRIKTASLVSVRGPSRQIGLQVHAKKDDDNIEAQSSSKKTSLVLNSTMLPLTLAAVNPVRAFLEPQAAYFKTLDLPEWLVHWGHPGNMAVVLFAMGGYGALYLGWQIRTGKSKEIRDKARDMHPKLAGGMAIFFALGALGGMMSLLMQEKDIFSSPHFVSGITGLVALALQAMLPLFFEDDPNARSIHAYLGTGIMALFFVHAALGLQLGLSI
eukprot:jgi/Picsp_1/1657/NSC_05131-R1_protein